MRAFPRTSFAGIVLAVLTMSGTAPAQDLLRIFIPGDPRFQLMGGNPFPAETDILPAGANAYLRYDARFDTYYGEERNDGSSPLLGGTNHSLTLALPLASGARFGLNARSVKLISRARNTSDQLLDYDNSQKIVRFSYETPLAASIRWNLSLGHSNASTALFQDIGTSVSFRASSGTIALNVDRSAHAQQLGIEVAGVQGLLPLDHENTTVSVHLAGGDPTAGIAVNGYQTLVTPLPGSTTGPRLHFAPAGFIRGWESRFEASLGTSWKAICSLDGLSFNGEGTFTSSGSRYGLLERAEYRQFSASGGVMTSGERGSVFVADFKWMQASGSFAGFAEGWPFVSVFESLLTQRGSFHVEGSFRLFQAHAGVLMPAASWLTLGGGITAMSLAPALRVESWQPGFLGIGLKAYADRRLSIERIGGAMVSGGFRVNIGSTKIDYSASQFIPVHVTRAGTSGSAADFLASPAPGSVVRSWGGLFQRVCVEVEGF